MKWRRTWLRDTRVVSLVDTFVLSALTSLLLVRLYLFLTGYPQVGGGGIHVAHMVWGGLLMLVAMIIAISFVSVTARWITAVVGGIGFGLFVDEIGKFLTSDNNYFFRPSAALIYGVLAVVFIFSRSITRRTGFRREEYLANALDVLKESAVRNFDAMEKRRAEKLLERAGDSPLAEALREVLSGLEPDAELSHSARFRLWLRARYERVSERPWFGRVIGIAVLVGAISTLVEIAAILLLRHTAFSSDASGSLDDWANAFGALSFVATIEVVAALVSLGLAVAGLKRGAATPGGLRMFERCILTWIVVIQPFAFYEAQFFASAGILLSLPQLALVQYVLAEKTGDEDDTRRGEVERANAPEIPARS